jgi:transcriptional regulator with XRE-family HTH domain
METFGKRLAVLRQEKGWSQHDLSKKVRVSPSAIRFYETERSTPGFWTLIEIGKALDVSLDYLCLGEK